MGKTRENNEVRHNNMTQIASLIAVATVFIGLWILFYSQGEGVVHKINYLCRNLS